MFVCWCHRQSEKHMSDDVIASLRGAARAMAQRVSDHALVFALRFGI